MFKLACLVVAATATIIGVQAGIDLFITTERALKEGFGTECWNAALPAPWYADVCSAVSPLSTTPQMDPNYFIGGQYPSHMYHPGMCGSNPLDFYDTGNGYDVYYSGGDGTLLGHCDWNDQTWNCGQKTCRKLYSCNIPVC